MNSSTDQLKTLLEVRENELEAAVHKLVEKRSGLERGLSKLRTLHREKTRISEEVASEVGDGPFEPVIHGRYLARLRREVMRLNREITGLQEIVDIARSKVKSAHGRHGVVELLIDQRKEKELLFQSQRDQRLADGDACQRFVANENRSEAN